MYIRTISTYTHVLLYAGAHIFVCTYITYVRMCTKCVCLNVFVHCSLQLMGKLTHFKKQERSELLRRRTVLLLYLLRSPFFDTVFK